MSSRRPSTRASWGPSGKEVEVARAALHLREVVDQVEVLTFNQFVPMALLRGHPLNLVLHFALQLRVNRRSRRTVGDVCRALQTSGRMPAWLRMTLKRAFTLYGVFRALAVPRGRRPSAVAGGGPGVSGRLARFLAGPGVQWEGRVARRSIEDRALEARQALHRDMQGKPYALWVDNFNSLRYVVDPLLSMQVLNGTAVAVLPLRQPAFTGPWTPPAPMDLVRAVPLALDDVLRYGSVLRDLVNTVVLQGPPQGQV